MGIVDAEANAIMGFPMQEKFGHISTWDGRYVTSLQGNSVVVDANFNVLYKAEKNVYLEVRGSGLVERKEEAFLLRDKRLLNSKFEVICVMQEGWDLYYYDGNIMILYERGKMDGYILCDGKGDELWGGCEWIAPGCAYGSYDAQQFVVYKDGTAYVLDNKGKELTRKEGDYSGCRYIGPGRYVLSGSGDALAAPGYPFSDCVVDENLEMLSKSYRYMNPSGPRYLTADGYDFLTAILHSENYTTERIDVLDTDGRILLSGLTEVQHVGPDRLVVVWGFSCGLVDRQGSWLYKTSAFGVLEDE